MTAGKVDGTSGSIRVLVVDDYEPWRRFVCLALRVRPAWQVIREASDGLEAVQSAKELQPDLIVLDIGLPTINGIEAARRIRRDAPTAKILFLSENQSCDIVEEAFRLGADGYVVKSNAAKELLPALEAVLQGKRFLRRILSDQDLASLTDEIRSEVAAQEQSDNADVKPGHQVEFYPADSAFVDGFANAIEAALGNGHVMVVIASESHHHSIRQRLRSDGLDIDTEIERNCYVPLELADSLSTIHEGARVKSIDDACGLAAKTVRAASQKHLHVAVG